MLRSESAVARAQAHGPSVVVVGDANADVTAVVRHFPKEGDDSTLRALGWGSGGSASNVAAALALLGTQTRLCARVGTDPAASVALQVAEKAGVDLHWVQRDKDVATGLCFCAVSPSGERTFFSYRGANVRLAEPPSPGLFDEVGWIHVGAHSLLEGPQRTTTLALIEKAEKEQIPVSLDLCLPFLNQYRDTLFRQHNALTVLFANQPELGALMPAAPLDKALEQLGEQMPTTTFVIKLGKGGCWVQGPQSAERVPGFCVEAVDTNGCGDAFVAGFVHCFLQGAPLRECSLVANGIGALNAMQRGSADALPSKAHLIAFLREQGAMLSGPWLG